MLVVPLTAKHGKVPIKDVRIEYVQKWQNNQWRTIESAYRKASFFEYYAETLNKILYTKHEFLFDLNMEMLSFCLKSLHMAPRVSASVTYEKEYDKTFLDLRSHIQAKKSYSERSFYTPHNYYQVFGNAFVENLSLIDLLFCEGPRAGSIILASRKKD
jgi:hypothetical protein